jgi:hypothetical protein
MATTHALKKKSSYHVRFAPEDKLEVIHIIPEPTESDLCLLHYLLGFVLPLLLAILIKCLWSLVAHLLLLPLTAL